jgi:arylsulfatase A-like enzyme
MTLWDDASTSTPEMTTDTTRLANYRTPLLRDAVTIPAHFKYNNYRVIGAGKTFHEGQENPAWWNTYGGGPDYGPRLKRWVDPLSEDRTTSLQKYLFEDEPLKSYSARYRGLDRMWMTENGEFRHLMETSFGPLEELATEGPLVYADGSPFRISVSGRDPLPDEKTTEWALEQLQNVDDEPFFLNLGYIRPHTPMNVPTEYFARIPLDNLDLPPVLPYDLDDCARAMIDHQPYGFLLYHFATKGGITMWKRWLQAYLACICFVDDQVGKVLDALERGAHLENTIIVFTSDNGYHMGEKEYLFKDSLWDAGSQIPLIISAPDMSQVGKTCTRPVSLIDIYPTLVDLCDLPGNPNAATNGWGLQGHSLRPYLENPSTGVWTGPGVALTSVHGRSGVHHSVRSERYRYILCSNGEEELYDHNPDPHEWHNVANDSSFVDTKAGLREQWIRMVYGLADGKNSS